jgi:hypothetical protein
MEGHVVGYCLEVAEEEVEVCIPDSKWFCDETEVVAS